MLDWLFGRKKEEEQPKKKKPKAQQEADDVLPAYLEMEIRFHDSVFIRTTMENKHLGFCWLSLHRLWQRGREQVLVYYYPQCNHSFKQKFKEMVASLFDGMMQEVGLDDEKLAQLLQKGFTSKHKKIFNQLMLADDFMKFKNMMVNRNKTLEAEAIKAFQGDSKVVSKPKSQEDAVRQSVLSEQERLRKIEQQEQQQLRKALQMSKIQAKQNQMIKKLEEKVAQKQVVQPKQQVKVPEQVKPAQQPQQPHYFQKPLEPAKIAQPVGAPVESVPVVVPVPASEQAPAVGASRRRRNLPSNLDPLPPVKGSRKIEESPKQQQPKQQFAPKIQQKPQIIEEKPQEPKPVVEQKSAVESQDDRKKRLMEQRQRIRRKKEEERKKQMAQQQAKPAPVQTIVLQEDGIHQTQVQQQPEEKKVNNAEIQRRRELMKKIKNRIVDDF